VGHARGKRAVIRKLVLKNLRKKKMFVWLILMWKVNVTEKLIEIVRKGENEIRPAPIF
jgi:hypothetical protein